jgi:peroxiredoxin
MTIAVGDRLPDVEFRRMGPRGEELMRTADLFAGRKVALFGVPGAFTPTCHNMHVPDFLARADELGSKGVDAIVCVSVNDVFVMDAWSRTFGDDHALLFVSDWNAAFARATGLAVDRGATLGVRITRFSMLVDDGTVTALHIEDGPGKIDATGAANLMMAL